jgi:hypothetical protein
MLTVSTGICLRRQQLVVQQESAALATAMSLCFVSAGTCLPCRCPAMNVFSDFTVPAFGRHVTMYLKITWLLSNILIISVCVHWTCKNK